MEGGSPLDHAWQHLLDAWVLWDRHPGDPGVAGRMESACWAVSKLHHVRVVDLRNQIAEGRREGHGRSMVLQLVREKLEGSDV